MKVNSKEHCWFLEKCKSCRHGWRNSNAVEAKQFYRMCCDNRHGNPSAEAFSWLIPTPTLSYVIQLRKFKWPMVIDHLHDHHHHGQNSNARAVSHSCASSSPSKIILVTGNKFLGLGQPRSVSHRGARLLWWRWRFTCRWKTAEFFFFKFSFFLLRTFWCK